MRERLATCSRLAATCGQAGLELAITGIKVPFKGWEGGLGVWDRVSGGAGMAVFLAKHLGPQVRVQYLVSVFCPVGIKGHYRTIF